MRIYNKKPDPVDEDQALIWDSENSDWRLSTLNSILRLREKDIDGGFPDKESEIIDSSTITLRRGTEAAWFTANPILEQGEVGITTDGGYFKIGDGATAWNDIPESERYYNASYFNAATLRTEAEWIALNPVIKEGGIGVATDAGYFYIGDGVTAWNSFSEGERYYNKAGDFEYIISRTEAEWTALNPTLEENQIGIASDAGYFKTGDGVTAWNSLTGDRRIAGNLTVDGTIIGGEPVSLGDFDISATDHTTDLDALDAIAPVGASYKVSGYGGDGSHSHRFTGTGHSFDGIDPTVANNWKCEGVFFLQFRKVAAKTWQTSGGDVWDSHGGGFAGTFQKYVNGTIKQALSTTINTTVSTGSGGIFVSGTLGSDNFPVSAAAVESLNTTTDSGVVTWVVADASTASNLTRWGSYRLADSISNASASDYNIYRTMTGSWTTGYPRRT